MNNFDFSRKNALRGAALASVVALGMGASASALADTATSNADATIVAALTLTNTGGLSFGSVVADGTGTGTVEMTSGGVRTCTTVVCADQDPGQASSFTVAGEPSFTYAITLPTTINITHTDGETTMSVGTFIDSETGAGALDGTGNGAFTVGATLNVAAAQLAGDYTGTFDVTVDYQ